MLGTHSNHPRHRVLDSPTLPDGQDRFVSALAEKRFKSPTVAKRSKPESLKERTAATPVFPLSSAANSNHKQRGELNTIRILVVDDHPLFRHGLVQLLNSEAAFSVVGEASSAPEAMTSVRRLNPTLAIVDLGLKGPSGLELTKSLRAEFPKLPVLILSMHDEPTYAVRSLRAGANGYVTKEEALGSVLVAVREVLNGRTYLSPGMASDVIASVVLTKQEPGADPTNQLTDREIEILERIGKGEEVKAIAEALHLSPKTVETHRAHIKEKLKLRNAREVARFAVQWRSAPAT
jgi:DNA-binding NarL/FixJ family response regulator